VVTPRLHGIHHTATRADTDSNWSSGLTIWDRLHGTLRTIRARAPIGVPGYRYELSLRDALALPFRAEQNRRASFAR
jgi:sterol desaturase/sphingolipid hydroxylase (fatty acid hydroxylase superfamily)